MVRTGTNVRLETINPPITHFVRSFTATDPLARVHMGESIVNDPFADEKAVVGSLKVPVAVLIGACDRLVNADYLRAVRVPSLFRGAVQVIQGAGHCPQYDAPMAINRLLLDFLSETAEDRNPFLHLAAAGARRLAALG